MMFLSKTFYLSDYIKCRDPHICTVPGDYLEKHKCHSAIAMHCSHINSTHIYLSYYSAASVTQLRFIVQKLSFSILISEIH